MEAIAILLLIPLAFAVLAGFAAADGSDSRSWGDLNRWSDEAPKAI